jgi:hypothetical protein
METFSVMLKYLLNIVLFCLYFSWLFGIKFSRKKQVQYNEKKKVIRKDWTEKWNKYRAENSRMERNTYEVRNQYGQYLGTETYSVFVDPGRRFTRHIFYVVALNIMAGVFFALIGSLPIQLRVVLFILLAVGVVYRFRTHFVYEAISYKLLYTAGFIVYFQIGASLAFPK